MINTGDPLIPEYHHSLLYHYSLSAERSTHYYALCYELGDPTIALC